MMWATRPDTALSSLNVAQLNLFGIQLLAVHLCWKPPQPQEELWNHNTAVLYREPVSQLACSALVCPPNMLAALAVGNVFTSSEDSWTGGREPASHYNFLFRIQNLRLRQFKVVFLTTASFSRYMFLCCWQNNSPGTVLLWMTPEDLGQRTTTRSALAFLERQSAVMDRLRELVRNTIQQDSIVN